MINSQYNIPQNHYASNNYEAQQAALISANLEAQQAQQVADFSARLDARQQAIEAATLAARDAAMAVYAQQEAQMHVQPQTQMQAQPYYQQQQPVVSEPIYRERAERNVYATPNYEIKEVENTLEGARKAQLELDAKKSVWSKTMKSFVVAPKPPLAVLKEEEGVIGGEIVSALYAQQGVHTNGSFRFFYDDRDWFLYSEGHYDDAVHYEVTDEEIKKSQYGHRVPTEPGEEAALRVLAPMYLKAVIEKMYPIDAIITDLMSPEEAGVDIIQRAA